MMKHHRTASSSTATAAYFLDNLTSTGRLMRDNYGMSSAGPSSARMQRGSRLPVVNLVNQPGWVGSIARFWEKTYAPDYVGFIFLVTAYILIVFFVTPFHRMFFINNMNLQYPHALVERVSVEWNFVYAGGVPLVTLIIFLKLFKADAHKFHVSLLGFFIAIALSSFITDVIKNMVGRPRPDLISRCKPAPGTPENVLVAIDVCTETDRHTLQDGWRSFPSGHSNMAFAGLGYLSLFFCGQLHVFRPRTDLGKALLAFSPLLGAAIIAISRCEDYRHDVYDVTCGSILGMGITYFSYRRYYPRLHSSRCDIPYPSRETAFNEAFGKFKDDEEVNVRDARSFGTTDSEDEN